SSDRDWSSDVCSSDLYRNDYGRLGGNGPMDDTTRKIVTFVREFSASNLTPGVIAAVDRTMVDTMAALVSGFEAEPCRVAARLARSEERRVGQGGRSGR